MIAMLLSQSRFQNASLHRNLQNIRVKGIDAVAQWIPPEPANPVPHGVHCWKSLGELPTHVRDLHGVPGSWLQPVHP